MFDKTANKMLKPINTAGVSILGAFNLLMGLWICLPFDALAFIVNVPEWLIASIMIIIGSFILSGSIKEKYRTLLTGIQFSFYFWFILTGVLLYIQWQIPLWIVALMISAYSLFVAVNIKVNKENLPFKKH